MASHDKNSTPASQGKPKSPMLPGDDGAMPPYTPGGVPAPPGDGLPEARDANGGAPDNSLPPKARP